MALIDLSLVTSALMKLLEDNINKNIDTGANVSVTAEPPDKVGSVTNKLSLYMYHVAEEAYYKNMAGPGSDARNIARTPMGLNLFYILTAHHESSEPEFDPLTQQRLMGYALKTMHDYPMIFDGTKIDDETILPAALIGEDNPVQIIMRPTAPEDAIAFWGSEDQQTARLSAYYEVRVILLEPEEPATMGGGPVLSLGTFLYQLGAPHLECTQADLPFVLPASVGGSTQVVQVTPARISAEPGEDPARNRLELIGQNLLLGAGRQVWLRNELWSTIELADGSSGSIPVDLDIVANQADWSLSAVDDKLVLEIGGTLTYIDDAEQEASVSMLPGIYTVFVRVTLGERIVAGELIPITTDSNEVALAVGPRIASTSTPGIHRVQVTIEQTFSLNDPDVELRLVVDGEVYIEQTLSGSETDNEAGLYQIDGNYQLTLQALFFDDFTGDHAIRLIANGAESAPFWIELP